jgi:hypothetical protein
MTCSQWILTLRTKYSLNSLESFLEMELYVWCFWDGSIEHIQRLLKNTLRVKDLKIK